MFNTVDAAALAAQFATLEVSASRERYNERTDRIDDQRVGLGSLKTALSSFESSLAAIRDDSSPLLSSSATISNPSFFEVEVGENALETSYEIFSQQLAQRHTIANTTTAVDGAGNAISGSSVLPDFGIISIALNDANGSSRNDIDGAPIDPLTVDLASDLPPSSTLKDLVDFINTSSANPGVTLSLVNSNGQLSLMTSSQISGVNANILNSFTEDGLDPDPAANDWLQSLFSMSNSSQLAPPQNAIMKLGNELTGLTLESETNTFENVFDDVSITLKQAMPSGADTVELTVAADKSATRSKLNNIVESYNTLMDNFDFLLASGGEESDRGSLADFAAVKSMKRQISNQFRSEYNGSTLFSVGLEIDSKGKMLINSSRFDQTYEQTPEIFDSMLKSDNGLLDQVDAIVGSFTGITGSVQSKLDYTQQQLDLIDQKLLNLDNQYERQYQRYLQQFTSLNSVIDQMNSTSGLFAF